MDTDNEQQIVEKLANNAGHIVEMIKAYFTSIEGCDIRKALIFSSALAGHACHEAVKAENGKFTVITTSENKKFYFGDATNKYLIENDLSVVGFITAICQPAGEEVKSLFSDIASNIGTSDFSVCGMDPHPLYEDVHACWKGIDKNMTSKYCENPSEWPVLYGIVVQNILMSAIKCGAPKDEAGKMALECAIVFSKLDNDSF